MRGINDTTILGIAKSEPEDIPNTTACTVILTTQEVSYSADGLGEKITTVDEHKMLFVGNVANAARKLISAGSVVYVKGNNKKIEGSHVVRAKIMEVIHPDQEQQRYEHRGPVDWGNREQGGNKKRPGGLLYE